MRCTLAPARFFKLRGAAVACGGTTTHSAFTANTSRVPAASRSCCWAWSMVVSSADANTSTGAPRLICCSSTPEAAKLKSTLVPGCAFS
ncbi:hypothetical protein G6F32_016271 [Rhizopus arrhizus]|nr:hypothetical protein G6F32_016271 [Rhizopus arrhizus]